MSRKRRNTSSAEPDSPASKKFQTSSYEHNAKRSSGNPARPQTDALTGLTSAFPGLDDGDNLFYGPARDGLGYLRMVRTEAKSIPSFLSAPTTHHDEPNEEEDHEGFFDDDEAIVAMPLLLENAGGGMSKAQERYYKSILDHYQTMRTILSSTPPLSAIQSLPESTPISFPANSKLARNTWEAFIASHTANPVQIASMEADSALEFIRLVTKKMRRFMHSSKEEDIRRMGSWIWAMLAKSPDRGQLSSEEISDLRACAKAAAMTRDWLRARAEGDAAESHVVEDDDDEESLDDEGQNANEHIPPSDEMQVQESNDWPEPRRSEWVSHPGQHIILDTIVTVVGEVYGQRDLLELRRPWPTGDGG